MLKRLKKYDKNFEIAVAFAEHFAPELNKILQHKTAKEYYGLSVDEILLKARKEYDFLLENRRIHERDLNCSWLYNMHFIRHLHGKSLYDNETDDRK